VNQSLIKYNSNSHNRLIHSEINIETLILYKVKQRNQVLNSKFECSKSPRPTRWGYTDNYTVEVAELCANCI
jgi:hypothetical protein